MKILHIGKFFPPFHGGMENFLYDLAREQAEAGHDVSVLCHHHEKGRSTDNFQTESGAAIFRVSILGMAAYAPVAPEFYRVLKNLLGKLKPDVVHVHMPNVSVFWLLLIKKHFKLVVHWHSDVVSSENDWKIRLLYPFYSLPENRILAMADAIISTSNSYLETSSPLKHYKEKCRVIPLGVRLDKFVSPQNNLVYDTADEDACILSVGRFTYYKGFEHLIRACKEGYQGRLVIVGDGPLRQYIQKLVRESGLCNRVDLPGKLSHCELQRHFKECCAFCLPSIERTEAFGVVLLEAMFYGKPLITTRVLGSGMNEVNIHNETGLVVEPADAAGLAKAMNNMLKNRDRAEEMGKNGRKRLVDKFLISKVAQKVEKAYSG